MKQIIKSPINDIEYKRFKIPNNFVSTLKGKRSNEISIVPPKICPICGKKDVEGEFKIKTYGKKFMIILLCREHSVLAKKDQKPIHLVLSLISFILVILFMPILFLLTNIFITLIVFGIILSIFIFSIYKGVRGAKDIDLILEYINLKYFKTFSIVLIKRLDWADEFESLNKVKEYKIDLELIKELKKKKHQSLINLGIIVTIYIGGVIILAFLFLQGIIDSIIWDTILKFLSFLLIGATILFIGMRFHYDILIKNIED